MLFSSSSEFSLSQKIAIYVKDISEALESTSSKKSTFKVLLLIDFLYSNFSSSRMSFTLRELYYILNQKHGFKYAETAALLKQLCSDLNVPRSALYVFPETNLFFFGDIQTHSSSSASSRFNIISIPAREEDFFLKNKISISPRIKTLVIIEKYSFFERVSQLLSKAPSKFKVQPNSKVKIKKFLALESSLFCCGKGFPTLSSRTFLKRFLSKFPDIRAFSLTDGDPHGVLIHRSYKKDLPDLEWLGISLHFLLENFVRGEKMFDFGVLECLKKLPELTEREKSIGVRLRSEEKDVNIRKHLEVVLEVNRKVELEVLALGGSEGLLFEYIERAIRNKWARL